MKKLRLQLDDLQVDSFATDSLRDEEGTVLAHISCRCTNAQGGTCGGGASCNWGPTCDTDCSGVTYVDSCPCYPNTDNEATCEYTCVETCRFPC